MTMTLYHGCLTIWLYHPPQFLAIQVTAAPGEGFRAIISLLFKYIYAECEYVTTPVLLNNVTISMC